MLALDFVAVCDILGFAAEYMVIGSSLWTSLFFKV